MQSTSVCAGTRAERARLKAVHVDAGRNGTSKIFDNDASCSEHLEDIVVVAHAEGMPIATVQIPTTSDVGALPMALAAQLPSPSSA